MVKAVVGEEIQLKLAEDRIVQSGVPVQVGLVIGKLSSGLDRGFVFDLVPTPHNDAGEPACSLSDSARDDKKRGSKGKSQAEASSLVIDSDWVAEHARQVSRMLLGGMTVAGIYIWASENSFKTSNMVLWQTVKGVGKAAPLYESDLDERLLIHISYSPRRWTCRSCMLGSSVMSTSLRPCDFKMGRILASLQTFRCMYNFEIRLPIFHENASNNKTMRDILCDGISFHAKELKGAKALIDGKLVDEEEPCISDGLHEVELLLPFMRDVPAEACVQKEVSGILMFSGSVCSFAYLSPKEPISQVIADIKGDIITSLRSRLDIVCDETEGNHDSTVVVEGEAVNEISTEQFVLHLLRKPCSLSFPRRVLIPWLASAFICDYLQPSETVEVLEDHCKELMSMDITMGTSSISEPETEAMSLTSKSFWDVVVSNHLETRPDHQSVRTSREESKRTESNSKAIKSIDFSIITAISILLISVLVGLFIYSR